MKYVLSPEEVEFSRGLKIRETLQKMGFAADAVAEEGDSIRVFCPIHKDQIIRSLVINKKDNRYHCQYKSCPAHQSGELVELLALYLGVEVPDAVNQFQSEEHPEKQLTSRADQLIGVGKMQEAKRLLQEAVRLAPRDEVTRCKLAAVYLETNERERGFREYLVAAEDFAVKNQIEKTLSIYNILIMLSPSDVRVRRHLALLFSRLGRHQEAAEHLKWVVDQLMLRGDTDEAIKTVGQILNLGVEEPEVLMLHAGLLSQLRRINEAVGEAQRAAELALARGNLRTAEQAVTFGLIYRPQDEQFLEMEAQLKEASAPSPLAGGPAGGEDDFGEWLGSLEEEIAAETPVPSQPARAEPAPSPAPRSQPAPSQPAAPPPPGAQPPVPEPVASRAAPDPFAPLEQELPPPPPQPAPASKPAATRTKEWLRHCRETLNKLDNDQLGSMGQQLRSMLDDVQARYEEGFLEEWELKIICDFYGSFRTAYDEVRQTRTAEQ